jgi:hypothetical protein
MRKRTYNEAANVNIINEWRPQDDFNNRYGFALHIIMVNQITARMGLKKFGNVAAEAIITEFQQFHDKEVFIPTDYRKLTEDQKRRALKAITLIEEKRSGKIKGCTVANGSAQRPYITKEDAASPTISLEALFLSCIIDAYKQRCVVTTDISRAFLQADMDDFVLVKFEGKMVDLMCMIDESYKEGVHIDKKGKKVLYVQLRKAMYGFMKAAKLFWKNLSAFLVQKMGFKVNPYKLCIANKMINGKQCTIGWHVDDLKISHVDPEVIEKIIQELENKYGVMSKNRGKEHTYLGMKLVYNDDGTVTIDMKDYVNEIIEEFPEEFNGKANTPASEHIFSVDDKAKPLDDKQREVLHRIVAKLLFATKRA